MPLDYRVEEGWVDDPKTHHLIRLLGFEGPYRLHQVWSYTTRYRPTGDLTGIHAEDLFRALGWGTKGPDIWTALLEAGWIEKVRDRILVHEWREHQPWVSAREKRSERALRGWEKRREGGQGSVPAGALGGSLGFRREER